MKSSPHKSKQPTKLVTKKTKVLVDSRGPKSVLDPKIEPETEVFIGEKIQEAISESMRSTPSTAQMVNIPCTESFQSHEVGNKGKSQMKIPNFEIAQSHSPPNPHTPNTKNPQRKHSRSNTTINTPNKIAGLNNFHSTADCVERRLKRTSTEIQKINPNQKPNSQIFHNFSNSLSNNYKNEQIPSRLLQKEKNPKNEPLNVKFRPEETEKFESANTSLKNFNSSLKHARRFSVTSNGSLNSFVLNEAQFDLLSELTKSVKELNQRLVRSEEVTYERLKENLEMKTKIKKLETKIEEQKGSRLDTEGIRPGCSSGCSIF